MFRNVWTYLLFFLLSFNLWAIDRQRINLDCSKVISEVTLHQTLKSTLNLSPTYGANLDALWDELSNRDLNNTTVVLKNASHLPDVLGVAYCGAFLQVFLELMDQYPGFEFLD